MTQRTKIDMADLRRRLQEERAAIIHDDETTEAERATVVLDQTSVGRLSRMDALQNQAMQKETERRRKVELQRIEAALKRMDDGDYGFCVACDEEISAKRLDMDPATPLCIACANKA